MALFSSAYHFTPRSADLILVQAETTKSFAISLTCWIILIISNIPRNPLGAPLLGLARPIYYYLARARCMTWRVNLRAQ